MANNPASKTKNNEVKVIIIKAVILNYYKQVLIGLSIGTVLFFTVFLFYNNIISKRILEKKVQAEKEEFEKQLDLYLVKSLKFQSLEAPVYFDLIKLTLSQRFQNKDDEMNFVRSIYKADNYGIYLRLGIVLDSTRQLRTTNKNTH